MYLFIYCEWLDSELVKLKLPKAKLIMKARLPDYRLIFSSFTEDDSSEIIEGGCNIEEDQELMLWGVIYDISEDDLSLLDKMTRVEHGRYSRKYLKVIGEDGIDYEVVAHVIKNPIGKSKASREYMNHMVKGAKEHKFPNDYIKSFEKWRS